MFGVSKQQFGVSKHGLMMPKQQFDVSKHGLMMPKTAIE
jgi:hypothetical protein